MVLKQNVLFIIVKTPQRHHLTCVARLERQDGPRTMLTELEDCVSLVFPPSAAERPEMTKPLEKLRLPNSRLSVELEEDTWLERCWPVAEARGPVVDKRGTWEKTEAMEEVLKDSWLLERRCTSPGPPEPAPCWLSRMGPDRLVTGGRWPWGCTERLRYSRWPVEKKITLTNMLHFLQALGLQTVQMHIVCSDLCGVWTGSCEGGRDKGLGSGMWRSYDSDLRRNQHNPHPPCSCHCYSW